MGNINKNELLELSKELGLEKNIELSEIPELDLYMDQVIQMFEGKFSSSKRNEEEKLMTKTMINNYAKAKLLMSIKKKKYSKEHVILMSLIYSLKGGLSMDKEEKNTLLAGGLALFMVVFIWMVL